MTKEEVSKYANKKTDYFYCIQYGNVQLNGNFDATEPKDIDENKWKFITLQQKDNKREPILIDGNLITKIERI